MLEEPNDGFNGADYYESKVLLFDSLSEDWGAEEMIGFSGEELFDVLKTKTDVDKGGEAWKKAYQTIWRLLTKSSMQKITHGKNLTKGLSLGILWDLKENEGADVEKGSFAELLRWGSVHLEQERKEIKYIEAPKMDPEKRLKKGLLEA